MKNIEFVVRGKMVIPTWEMLVYSAAAQGFFCPIAFKVSFMGNKKFNTEQVLTLYADFSQIRYMPFYALSKIFYFQNKTLPTHYI